MYDRMIKDHGYSVRKLAQKLGKDKGYLENRLRLADAPQEVRDLVSLRKDTLSHAYELMKIDDPKKRKRLAGQVARGELSLVKLREKIEGRPARVAPEDDGPEAVVPHVVDPPEAVAPAALTGDDALVLAKNQLQDALAGLIAVLRSQEFTSSVSPNDRQNLAKYLTISKLTLENVITVVRGPETRDRD